MVLDFNLGSLKDGLIDEVLALDSAKSYLRKQVTIGRTAKGQLISKCLLEKIVWTKIATKKFDNFCPGGQIKKNKDTLLH